MAKRMVTEKRVKGPKAPKKKATRRARHHGETEVDMSAQIHQGVAQYVELRSL